ncbi:hypothetical protein ACCC92_27945, partial [Mucilaginibacter sp. Mucisp84]|uniref:hypothetical protein n=1 Tax=Mucilaginibacter sp. Mucisp84 TaxID=3243058 RepID=UPI0039A51B3F
LLSCDSDRAKCHIADHLPFIVRGNASQRDQPVFAQIVHQRGFSLAAKTAAQQGIDTGCINGNFNMKKSIAALTLAA